MDGIDMQVPQASGGYLTLKKPQPQVKDKKTEVKNTEESKEGWWDKFERKIKETYANLSVFNTANFITSELLTMFLEALDGFYQGIREVLRKAEELEKEEREYFEKKLEEKIELIKLELKKIEEQIKDLKNLIGQFFNEKDPNIQESKKDKAFAVLEQIKSSFGKIFATEVPRELQVSVVNLLETAKDLEKSLDTLSRFLKFSSFNEH